MTHMDTRVKWARNQPVNIAYDQKGLREIGHSQDEFARPESYGKDHTV